MSPFVDAYNTDNGKIQRVPRGWIGHPVLGVNLSLTPQATVAELTAEIAKRNKGREEAAQIKPASTRRADLAAAIESDNHPN